MLWLVFNEECTAENIFACTYYIPYITISLYLILKIMLCMIITKKIINDGWVKYIKKDVLMLLHISIIPWYCRNHVDRLQMLATSFFWWNGIFKIDHLFYTNNPLSQLLGFTYVISHMLMVSRIVPLKVTYLRNITNSFYYQSLA